MKRLISLTLLILSASLLISFEAFPWGSDAHALITQKAIEMLPDEIRPLFDANVEELARLSNVPDKEWKANPEYAYRNAWHYLDIDLFSYGYPFKDFPRDRQEAAKLYEQHEKEAGYLPWTMEDFYGKLVDAFKQNDKDAIIENAGLISHFAGDASMPLHATRNYNGKFSGNLYYRVDWGTPEYMDKGVHQRFELGLIAHRLEEYTREVETTREHLQPIDNVLEQTFSLVVDSIWHKDHIIYFDKVIARELDITKDIQSFKENRNAYYDLLDKHLGHLAIQRLQTGAIFLGNLWYSAWREAGGSER